MLDSAEVRPHGVPFIGPTGARRVLCPLCGRDVRVISQDDTRWRYDQHIAQGDPDDECCDNSQELLP
jgi:hypothetical protein